MLKNQYRSKLDGFVKSHISPPLVGGDKGEGEDNYLKHQSYSPSPRPSPIKGEGVFGPFAKPSNLRHFDFGSRSDTAMERMIP